jgi:hypothetical protein
MTKISVWISALTLLLSVSALAGQLMPAKNFIPQSREALLLTPEELRQVEGYRKDGSYASVRLFLANMGALRSDVIDVMIGGKSQRYFAWERYGITQNPTTQEITRHGPDYPGADQIWSGSTSLPAKGRATAQFSWGGMSGPGLLSDHGLSAQFVVDGKMYTIGTLGRFHVLLVDRHPLSAIPGTEPQYVCVDSTGEMDFDAKPVPRCDRPQRVRGDYGAAPIPPIPPTLSEAEAEPFNRLHTKLKVSPLRCGPDEITYCEGMVRLSCNAGGDAPVYYYDNTSAELLGTCGFWVQDRNCMPQRWKTCAVNNRVLHIAEEPDPAR